MTTTSEIYRKYITVNNKEETVLYVKSLNAIYRMMKSALLFYKKLAGGLTYIVFNLNPYDPCVANKLINNKKLTVVWHVDDIKVSHGSNNIVTRIPKCLKKTHERLSEDESGKVNISRGKIH